jgi:hypothetical protein
MFAPASIERLVNSSLAIACALTSYGNAVIRATSDVLIVVFSKDRPVQLEALLRSAEECFRGDCSMVVLWRATSDSLSQVYSEVFTKYASRNISFVRESSFRDDLIALLNDSTSRGVMFLVDDLLFVDQFDASLLVGLNLLEVIPSLRLCPGISYCQTQSSASQPPRLSQYKGGSTSWLQFSWLESNGDWAMPVSTDGHIFLRMKILNLMRRLRFSAPNSLEKCLGAYRFLFKFSKGLCLRKAAIRNYAFNRVQSEDLSFPCGDWSHEFMLNQWLAGKHLDIKSLSNLPAASCHVCVTPDFEDRL